MPATERQLLEDPASRRRWGAAVHRGRRAVVGGALALAGRRTRCGDRSGLRRARARHRGSAACHLAAGASRLNRSSSSTAGSVATTSRTPSAPEASASSPCSRPIQAARTSASTTTSGSHAASEENWIALTKDDAIRRTHSEALTRSRLAGLRIEQRQPHRRGDGYALPHAPEPDHAAGSHAWAVHLRGDRGWPRAPVAAADGLTFRASLPARAPPWSVERLRRASSGFHSSHRSQALSGGIRLR